MSEYKKAGVDIDLQNELIDGLKRKAKKGKKILSGIGGFGGLYLFQRSKFKNPVLVSSCDGVGTKIILSLSCKEYKILGYDIVCHCINDILSMGCTNPLFFLDYFGCETLKKEVFNEVLEGIIEACNENGIYLLGGETAELKGIYIEGLFDIVGFIVGVLEKNKVLPKKALLKEGDLIIGLPSTGLHTNGYTLARKIIKEKNLSLDCKPDGMNEKLKDALLKPHISYLKVLKKPLENRIIKAIAHITGGGFYDNIKRILREDLNANIKKGSWKILPLFEFLKREGGLKEEEAYRVFNMGIGICIIIDNRELKNLEEYFKRRKQEFFMIGKLEKGKGEVVIV